MLPCVGPPPSLPSAKHDPPLTAAATVQVVEARLTSPAVSARHMGSTLALASHCIAATLLLGCSEGVTAAG